MFKITAFFLFLFLFAVKLFSQIDTKAAATFDFNDHEIKEKDNKVALKPEGVTLSYDRFGNERSAIYIHGHASSYLNLGTSALLKPKHGSISIWVNLERRVYSGKGADFNPIISTKNGPGFDFIYAYILGLDCQSNRYVAALSKDSVKEVLAFAKEYTQFNQWYHFVLAFDSSRVKYYINGELQGNFEKGYETKYLLNDSVIVGHSASTKNDRYSQGLFDDIQFFHRVLSEKEIQDLYHAPNPNRTRVILNEIMKYGSIVLFFLIVIVIIVIRNKRNASKQKEQLELLNRISELELKVVKAQMNPHFISNCLAAIQELIYTNNIEKAGQYLAKFSFFLRQVLNYSDQTYITLAEELSIIKLNIELEQLRFKDNFEYSLIVSDDIDTSEILIPSLITQPFVENAIWHGLLPLENIRKARLMINVFEKNGVVFVEVEDNGVGRDLNEHNSKHDSKGTKLVMDKIESINKLNKENSYKLEIIDLFDADQKPNGTKIIIQLKDNIE